MTAGGEDDDSVFEHVLTMDERGCRHTVCSAPVKHVFYTSKTGYVGVCRFHEDVYEEDIPSKDDEGVRGRQEIKRRREKANIRINNLYKTDAKIEREDIIEETLDWVLGEVDDL